MSKQAQFKKYISDQASKFMRGVGVKNRGKFADVLCGRLLIRLWREFQNCRLLSLCAESQCCTLKKMRPFFFITSLVHNLGQRGLGLPILPKRSKYDMYSITFSQLHSLIVNYTVMNSEYVSSSLMKLFLSLFPPG